MIRTWAGKSQSARAENGRIVAQDTKECKVCGFVEIAIILGEAREAGEPGRSPDARAPGLPLPRRSKKEEKERTLFASLGYDSNTSADILLDAQLTITLHFSYVSHAFTILSRPQIEAQRESGHRHQANRKMAPCATFSLARRKSWPADILARSVTAWLRP